MIFFFLNIFKLKDYRKFHFSKILKSSEIVYERERFFCKSLNLVPGYSYRKGNSVVLLEPGLSKLNQNEIHVFGVKYYVNKPEDKHFTGLGGFLFKKNIIKSNFIMENVFEERD